MDCTEGHFPGRAAIQQRVFAGYRAPFFDTLAMLCTGGLSLFAGEPGPRESVAPPEPLSIAQFAKARNIHFLQAENPYYFCWQRGLLAWLETWQPDVLLVEANLRSISTPQAVRWMHACGRPVLGWGLGAPGAGEGARSFLARRRDGFLRSLDGMIAYSQGGAEEFAALGFPKDRIWVALNAADPRPTKPPPPRPDRQPGVLFIGRLQARKRVDNLIRACAALPETLQPRLTIIGDGPELERLQSIASKVFPQVEFPGATRGDALEPYFEQTDLFVLPGTGGLAVQQAMAHGLPVIVADGDGTQNDLVKPTSDGTASGILIPPNDLKALTDALQDCLSDLPRLRKMGQAAYQVVVKEANIESMAASFVTAFCTLMGRLPGG
jgi:glycosyltransferase involved in cell wall biosynthesis